MKKRIIAAVFVFAIGIGLVSCAETPEKKIVVDKSKGLSKETIIPKEKDKIPKALLVPTHWQETIERNEGFVVLTADYDMRIPEIYNTPVYSYERVSMTDKLLGELCAYFSEGDRLYENPVMTKSELGEQKNKMVSQKGLWGRYAGPNEGERLKRMTAKVDELIEKAPEKKAGHEYIDAKLMVPQQMEVEYFKVWGYTAGWYHWYYDTDEKIGFTARIDRGRKIDPIIRAVNYDNKVGSTTAFTFSQGTFIDEIELEEDRVNQKAFNTADEEYINCLKEEMEQAVDETFSKEDALKEVDKMLKDLPVGEVAVTDCVKAIGTVDSESWAGLDEEELPKSVGFSVYLSPKAGDVIGYSLPRRMVYNDLPETMYAPSFLTEKIRIIVTKEGVQRFEWINISKRKDTIAENTKLLSFEDIKEKLVDHLLYVGVSETGGEKKEGIKNIYKVKHVQLRAANINAYEEPSTVWLVPVWVFDLENSLKYNTAEQSYEQVLSTATVVLNAIDGGYVTMEFD